VHKCSLKSHIGKVRISSTEALTMPRKRSPTDPLSLKNSSKS
jgi:hypothetical protein